MSTPLDAFGAQIRPSRKRVVNRGCAIEDNSLFPTEQSCGDRDADAGRLGGRLPSGAVELLGDAGVRQYVGGAPPAGSGVHDYYITVTALNVKSLSGITRASSADYTGFVAGGHTIARATIVAPTAISK